MIIFEPCDNTFCAKNKRCCIIILNFQISIYAISDMMMLRMHSWGSDLIFFCNTRYVSQKERKKKKCSDHFLLFKNCQCNLQCSTFFIQKLRDDKGSYAAALCAWQPFNRSNLGSTYNVQFNRKILQEKLANGRNPKSEKGMCKQNIPSVDCGSFLVFWRQKQMLPASLIRFVWGFLLYQISFIWKDY